MAIAIGVSAASAPRGASPLGADAARQAQPLS